MFTSRAEYRTLLRQDNADLRLTERGYNLGLAGEDRLQRVMQKQAQSVAFVSFLRNTSYIPEEVNPILDEVGTNRVGQADKLYKVFSRPNVQMEHMLRLKNVQEYVSENAIGDPILEQAEIDIKYAGYIEKERANADKLQRLENVRIPDNFDYHQVKSLSFEAREKLSKIQPATLSQASRISGVSPSDLNVLLVFLGR